jgi:hypothetical protein
MASNDGLDLIDLSFPPTYPICESLFCLAKEEDGEHWPREKHCEQVPPPKSPRPVRELYVECLPVVVGVEDQLLEVLHTDLGDFFYRSTLDRLNGWELDREALACRAFSTAWSGA